MKFLILNALLCIASQTVFVSSENILFLLPFSSKSHKNVFDPLIKALALKGHNITTVSTVKSSSLKAFKNVREIVPLEKVDLFQNFGTPFEARKLPSVQRMMTGSGSILDQCSKVYDHHEIQQMLKYDHFDLVIVNAILNHCFFGMIAAFNATAISLCTLPASNFNTEPLGTHFPNSFLPMSFLPFSSQMSFYERVVNFLVQGFLRVVGVLYYRPIYREVKNKYHGEYSPEIPDIEKNLSMMLVNSHFSINNPVPVNPDIVEVGGMHCRPSERVEQSLNEWLNGSEDGFIYFSFGSIIQGNTMPEEYRKSFINVFSKFPRLRILWKWEADMPDLPPNVKISKWLPQQDILGHPKIRMFITHGGLLSTQESVYHGVPIIGFPFFADQDLNMAHSEQLGFAIKLEILELTENTLENAIKRILNEPKFTNRAKELSRIFRDRPVTPLETAVFWSEYVLRHKGAPQLRPASRELNLFQYHSYDVIVFLASILLMILFILHKIICCIVSRTCRKSKKPKHKSKNE